MQMKIAILIFFSFLLISCQNQGWFELEMTWPKGLEELESEEYTINVQLVTCEDEKDTKCEVEKRLNSTISGKKLDVTNFNAKFSTIPHGRNKRIYFEINEEREGSLFIIYSGNTAIFDINEGETAHLNKVFWQDGSGEIITVNYPAYTFSLSFPETL